MNGSPAVLGYLMYINCFLVGLLEILLLVLCLKVNWYEYGFVILICLGYLFFSCQLVYWLMYGLQSYSHWCHFMLLVMDNCG